MTSFFARKFARLWPARSIQRVEKISLGFVAAAAAAAGFETRPACRWPVESSASGRKVCSFTKDDVILYSCVVQNLQFCPQSRSFGKKMRGMIPRDPRILAISSAPLRGRSGRNLQTSWRKRRGRSRLALSTSIFRSSEGKIGEDLPTSWRTRRGRSRLAVQQVVLVGPHTTLNSYTYHDVFAVREEDPVLPNRLHPLRRRHRGANPSSSLRIHHHDACRRRQQPHRHPQGRGRSPSGRVANQSSRKQRKGSPAR